MRRIYSILVLTAVLAGCQHEDDLTTGDVGTLTFSASIADAVYSRAVKGVDFATHGIHIAGYHTEGTFAEAMAADPTAIFPNIFDYNLADSQLPVPHVSKNGQDKFVLNTVKWKLDPDTYLSYFAWSQGAAATANSGIVAATKDNTTKGYPWIEVENVNDPALQIDVAAARHTDEQNHRVISAIDLDFKHILSKLTFVFKCSAGAKVTLGKMDLKYATDQIRSKGRYTFNTNPADSIGHFGGLDGYHAGTFSLGTHHVLANGQEVTAGEMLLIPQSVTKGFVTFDLEYTIASSEGTYTHTKTVDMPATKLLEGANHIYTIDIYGEQVIVHNAAVSGWIPDATPRLPFVPGPKGDTQLLLDGYDKPYTHVDGKVYWLDRSGYNRHMEIKGNNLTTVYNETDHCYNFDGTTRMETSHLIGAVTALSMDMVLEASAATQNCLFTCSNVPKTDRPFEMYYGWSESGLNNAIVFDSGGATLSKGRVFHDMGSNVRKRQMVSCMKQDEDRQQLYIDGGLVADAAAHTGKLGTITLMHIGDASKALYKGKIFYVKVTSKMNGIEDVVNTYQSCREKYSIPIDATYLPPIQNGLIFCYDGRHAPKTVGSTNYWIDEIGKNDAQHIGTVTYKGAPDYCYEVDMNADVNYMKMIYPVNMTNDFTAEFVLTSATVGDTPSPIFWGTNKKDGAGRYLFFHIPYHQHKKIYVDSPYRDRYSILWPADYAEKNKRKIVVRRKYGVQSQFFMSNNLIVSSTDASVGSSTNASTDIASTKCTIMQFGGVEWGGRFHAVRFYDRALTDAEMKQNYDFDVTTFKLTGK